MSERSQANPRFAAVRAVPEGLTRMPQLMQHRVGQILLVATPYDAYMLEEDGLLSELIYTEYIELGLSNPPHVTRAGSGEEASRVLREQPIDLIISMLRLGDMDIFRFGEVVGEVAPDTPLVLLIANELELTRLGEQRKALNVDNIYVWKGDAKLFLAIIKVLEDRWNVEHDTDVGGVGVIILIEDSVRYRSSLLPMMYSELVQQARAAMLDGLNRTQKLLRLRARPKVLIAETFEEGMELYERYREYLFGIITDVSFLHRGRPDPFAGIEFISHIRNDQPDVPALVQSSDLRNRDLAESIGVSFLHKKSRTLLQDLHKFMAESFGFGDFVFRLPDHTEVGRAADLWSMPRMLAQIPSESLEYHASRNHFSNWLRARCEFLSARELRPRTVAEFTDGESLRQFLIETFSDALQENRRGTVEDFSREHFDTGTSFARIGGGSLGGKARGLAFIDACLTRSGLHREFHNVHIFVPRSVVIGTDIFDEFLEQNGLRTTRLYHATDKWVLQHFLRARLPEVLVEDLRAYLEITRRPIAIRSSSLLEDSQYYPFAGVYHTYMIPNNDADFEVRLRQLCDAIKRVYASTFLQNAREYLDTTPHRIEEQKMAVILQEVVGHTHEHYFYPDFAGVAQSYNFYPFGQMKPQEGVASVALGLGQLVAEGGDVFRFSPAHPQVLPQSGKEFVDQSQRRFYALDLNAPPGEEPAGQAGALVSLGLDAAERHGTLHAIGSVWSADNQAFYDGISRDGVRVVTFAHVLKSELFPLAPIVRRLLDLGRAGMSGPVEFEFAVNMRSDPRQFAILQMRPYSAADALPPVDLQDDLASDALLRSDRALGNGVMEDIRDIVYIRPETFDAARTPEIARELAKVNEGLRREQRPYLLIGPGRWGSSNTWLGIPVNWTQISGAQIIVETAFEHFIVDPSQGSHFFHNLTSAGVAHLTIDPGSDGEFIDWTWLGAQPAAHESELLRHVQLDTPIEARIDGRTSRAIVLKHLRRSTGVSEAAADSDQPAAATSDDRVA